jgi:hypothetical protein
MHTMQNENANHHDTQLKLGSIMGNAYTYNAKRKHTQCNYVETKHKPTKLSK